MKAKNLALMSASVFTLVLFIGLTSAASLTIQNQAIPSSVTNTAGTFDITFDLVNSGVEADIDWNGSTITGGNAILSFSHDYINASETLNIVATVTFDTSYTGTISGTIEANPSGLGDSKTFNFSIEVTEPTPDWQNDFCLWDDELSENPGDLRLKIKDITVTGFGDDREWFPFDEIEVEVEVQNRGTDDIIDIAVEWGLYDTDAEEWVIDVDEADTIDVDEDEEEVLTFTFDIDDNMDIDLEDLDDGKHYVLYVRAFGEVDGGDYDGDVTCASKTEDIELILEKNFVILSNFEYTETVSCGTELQISADVWNVGTKDQDNVEVKVHSNVLGISELFSVGDINAFDKENLDATITIPEGVEEKTYLIYVDVYDEDGDIYENKYDDELSSYSFGIDVSGGCSLADQEPKAIISADLESGGKAGKPLVIRATITNTGDDTATYMINAAGYSEWATLSSINQETITLTSGASGDVVFTFNVLKDAIGDNLFDIELVSDNQLVASQPVSVSIEKGGVDFSSVFGDSWYLWLIGLVNVILVIIIIIVAVRVARK